MKFKAAILLVICSSLTASAEPEKTNTLTAQLGFLPAASFAGLEYSHRFHANFDVTASVSGGLTLHAGIVPHVRVQRGAWSVAAGVGAGGNVLCLSVICGAFADLEAEIVAGYETQNHYLLQLRVGVAGYPDDDWSDLEYLPFVGIGFGKAF